MARATWVSDRSRPAETRARRGRRSAVWCPSCGVIGGSWCSGRRTAWAGGSSGASSRCLQQASISAASAPVASRSAVGDRTSVRRRGPRSARPTTRIPTTRAPASRRAAAADCDRAPVVTLSSNDQHRQAVQTGPVHARSRANPSRQAAGGRRDPAPGPAAAGGGRPGRAHRRPAPRPARGPAVGSRAPVVTTAQDRPGPRGRVAVAGRSTSPGRRPARGGSRRRGLGRGASL